MEKHLCSWNIIWLIVNQIQCCAHMHSTLFTTHTRTLNFLHCARTQLFPLHASAQHCICSTTRAHPTLFHYAHTQLCSTMCACTQLCSTTPVRSTLFQCMHVHMEWFLVVHALNNTKLLLRFNELQTHTHKIAIVTTSTFTWLQMCTLDCKCECKLVHLIASANSRLQLQVPALDCEVASTSAQIQLRVSTQKVHY